MCVTDYAKCYEFYSTYFNFYPSELVHNDKGVDVTVFFRLNRGDELVDHHCFFFFEGPRAAWSKMHTENMTSDICIPGSFSNLMKQQLYPRSLPSLT